MNFVSCLLSHSFRRWGCTFGLPLWATHYFLGVKKGMEFLKSVASDNKRHTFIVAYVEKK